MKNSDTIIIHSHKIPWSDPEITILSVKDDTLGSAVTATDATTQYSS